MNTCKHVSALLPHHAVRKCARQWPALNAAPHLQEVVHGAAEELLGQCVALVVGLVHKRYHKSTLFVGI